MTVKVADTGQLSLSPEVVLRRTVVKAAKGESVATIARKYRAAPAQVAQWNKVSSSANFKPGQAVVLFLAPSAFVKASAGNSVNTRRHPVRRVKPKKH